MPPFTDVPKPTDAEEPDAVEVTFPSDGLPEHVKIETGCRMPSSPTCAITSASSTEEEEFDSVTSHTSETSSDDETKSVDERPLISVEPLFAEDRLIDGLRDNIRSLLKEKKKGNVEERAGKFYNLKGTYHFRRDELEDAERAYTRALRWYKQAHRLSHRSSHDRSSEKLRIKLSHSIASTLSNVSAVHLKRGNDALAVAYLEETLKLQEKVANARNEHVGISAEIANTLYNLGIAERSLGHCRKALESLTKAEEIYEGLYGPFHMELARVKDSIGTIYGMQGLPDNSLRYHRQALRIKAAVLDSHHPSVLRSMMDIANAHRRLGQLDKAEDMYLEKIEAQELALERALDPQYRRAIRADLAITTKWVDKVQRQRAYSEYVMPTISEEKDVGDGALVTEITNGGEVVAEITDEGVEISIVT